MACLSVAGSRTLRAECSPNAGVRGRLVRARVGSIARARKRTSRDEVSEKAFASACADAAKHDAVVLVIVVVFVVVVGVAIVALGIDI